MCSMALPRSAHGARLARKLAASVARGGNVKYGYITLMAMASVAACVAPTSSSEQDNSVQSAATSCSAAYGQCGGQGYTGPTCCVSGNTCQYSNQWYSQCVPG